MCMGPPRCRLQWLHRLWVYPHVYGATLPVVMAPASILGLSPCVWGHPQTDRFQPIDPGSIPMCMGPLELPRFHGQFLVCVFRSEERRVGKEGGVWWGTYCVVE